MDGVPHLTQAPIEPGQEFVYEFALPDAGTYLYHSHQRSNVQVPMGLFGALVVEEGEPVAFDRELTWVLSDWRLTSDGQLSDDFGHMMDVAMAGRIGNVVTINNRPPTSWPVRTGERLRLRIINVASARLFALTFDGHRPFVIAWDGQPVEPYEPAGALVLGPGMRADLSLAMNGEPLSTHAVWDAFYSGQSDRLATFAYTKEKALPARGSRMPPRLPPNRVPVPNIDKARRHLIAFGGGMMGGMMGHGMGGGMMRRGHGMMGGGMWTINGVAASGPAMEPFLTLDHARSYVLSLRNDTAFFHPIHLHGHFFLVIARNGEATRRREWRDTVLIPPRESADVALVADNPGEWMIHCHILDHQEAGMMGVIRVV
jgi:FtsP/CotA-like multicopper oxidase with cupredoxin domain